MNILIIEDEVNIANLLRKSLESVGNSVAMAHNGIDGFQMAETRQYNIIILDIMLPGMNGFEVAESLRQNGNSTPIIILTARDSINDRKNSFAAGANDYLVKPVGLDTLLNRIDKLLLTEPVNGNTSTTGYHAENPSVKDVTGELPHQKDELVVAKNKRTQAPAEHKSSQADSHDAREASTVEISALNKNIMDHAPISIITINKEGFVTSANKFFRKILRTKDFVNLNIFTSDFFIKENLVEEYRNLLAHGTPVKKNRCRGKNSKGEDIYLKIIATPIYDDHGNIEGALSMAIDNTEEVVAKNTLVNLNSSLEEKIKQRTFELNEANEELKKVLKIKSAFAADVSHEMRTSLAIIQGNLELMTRIKAITESGAESSQQILQEITRMSGMLSNLTSLTTVDSATPKLSFSKIDLNELIDSVCNSLKVVASEKNITIEHKNRSAEIEMIADKSKLEELLLNLIRNAIKYNKNDGWIAVEAYKAGNKVFIKIEDGGIGISKKHLPFIFERFYQIDSARTRSNGGSGLGLAISKWIAEIHGGKINVSSKVGEGSIFTIYLPDVHKDAALQAKLDI